VMVIQVTEVSKDVLVDIGTIVLQSQKNTLMRVDEIGIPTGTYECQRDLVGLDTLGHNLCECLSLLRGHCARNSSETGERQSKSAERKHGNKRRS